MQCIVINVLTYVPTVDGPQPTRYQTSQVLEIRHNYASASANSIEWSSSCLEKERCCNILLLPSGNSASLIILGGRNVCQAEFKISPILSLALGTVRHG